MGLSFSFRDLMPATRSNIGLMFLRSSQKMEKTLQSLFFFIFLYFVGYRYGGTRQMGGFSFTARLLMRKLSSVVISMLNLLLGVPLLMIRGVIYF